MAEVKFCGLTRAEDAADAVSLGAAFLGVIFAAGPRLRTPTEARALFDVAAQVGPARRVGVFGHQPAADVVEVAREAGLDVVQLHAASDPAMVSEIRRHFGGEVWRVLRLRGAVNELELRKAAEGVDALVVDALV